MTNQKDDNFGCDIGIMIRMPMSIAVTLAPLCICVLGYEGKADAAFAVLTGAQVFFNPRYAVKEQSQSTQLEHLKQINDRFIKQVYGHVYTHKMRIVNAMAMCQASPQQAKARDSSNCDSAQR